jgi:protein SCO1/2
VKRQFKQNALKSAFVGVCVGFLSMGATVSTVASASTFAEQTAQKSKTTDSKKPVELMADPNKVPVQLEDVGVKEHLGDQIDLDHLHFVSSEDGKPHALKEYFQSGKPTLVNLVYYECPMLCTLVLNGVMEGMKGLDWSIGKEYNVITISVNPKDDSETAQLKRQAYVKSYLDSKRDEASAMAGWHFFTAEEAQVKKLAGQLGFEYKYDPDQKEYAHPAVTFILTPEGKISRYLYGIQYRPRDLRLALLEASRGKIGNVFDRLLMFCYHYEPNSRGYALQAVRVMQAGGAATLAFLGGYLVLFWTRQRKGKAK